jgi:hypothetical protein
MGYSFAESKKAMKQPKEKWKDDLRSTSALPAFWGFWAANLSLTQFVT